jgi:putative membrane protein
MPIRWLFAAIHLLGFAIGLGAVWARYRCLRGPINHSGLRRALVADSWWALSAVLLISTGLLRAFAGYEKGAGYYLDNHLFLTKLGLLGMILAAEVVAVIILISWRRTLARGGEPDTSRAGLVATISLWQAVLLLAMLVMATGMARGVGAG